MKNYLQKKIIQMSRYAFVGLSMQLLLAGVLMANSSTAQNKKLSEIYLSVDFQEKSLVNVFKTIESKTGFKFTFTDVAVDKLQRVNLSLQRTSLSELLIQISKESELKFKRVNNNIHVTKLEKTDTNPVEEIILSQTRNITGKVTSYEDGEGLPGVNVVEKGTSNGTVTDVQGNYSLEVSDGANLVFSSVGYTQEEVEVGNRSVVDISMMEDIMALNEIVVTALGIERDSRTLSYSTQNVDGDELTKVVNPNLMNSLQGKIAGVSINNSPGVGGSVKVIIRGNTSIQRNNQPLYIIDGVPMSSGGGQTTNGLASGFDNGGDGISNINPEDIENINVLKGASAAAIYGSQAANGVVIITTKRGRAGTTKIDFSSTFNTERVLYVPELQNSYGQTSEDATESWGEAISSGFDNISGFYRTGTNLVNSISLSSGNEKMQTYASYTNTSSHGVLQDNTLSRNNIFLRQSANFFNNKLSVEANLHIIQQTIKNPPVSGNQQSVISSLYLMPRNLDLAQFSDFEVFDPNRNTMTQNWYVVPDGLNQNPYWIMNRMLREFNRNRTMLKLSLKYDISKNIFLQVRGNMDKSNITNELKNYYGTAVNFAGVSGSYDYSSIEQPMYYADALLNFTHEINSNLKFSGVIGTSITDSFRKGITAYSNELKVPSVFLLQNMQLSPGSTFNTISENRQQLQAVFGTFDINYHDWLIFNLTGRNDWSSNLSFTPSNSYFYPSFGLSVLMSEIISLPKFLSFVKIRASHATVGNTVPVYVTNPALGGIVKGSAFTFNKITPFTDLNPEKSKSFEIGTDIKLFNDRFNIDFTYYKTNTINQFFRIQVPPGTGYDFRYINGGDIQNSGIELTLGYQSSQNNDFRWNTLFNFSQNRNEVIELAEEFEQFVINEDLTGYNSILKVGGSYGDLYGQTLKVDDQGRILVTSEGYPIPSGTKDLLGNSNPDFRIGFNNNFTYKDFSLSILIDGSFGGQVMSLTDMYLDFAGVSKESGEARNNGGVEVNGVVEGEDTPVNLIDAEKWYKTIGNGIVGEYMYDATTVRFRELSFGYSLPVHKMNLNFLKGVKLSFIGRNLFYFHRSAPYDPDITLSTGNGFSGVDMFAVPATRNLGLKLDVTL